MVSKMKKNLLLLAFSLLAIYVKSQGFNYFLKTDLLRVKVMGNENTSNDYGRPIYEKAEDAKETVLAFSGGAGLDFKIFKINDELTVGANLNAGVGYIGAKKLEGLSGAIVLDFPEYATLRYGLKSSRSSKKNAGWGLGVGYTYTWTALPYYSPSVMTDFSFLENYTIRLSTNILKSTYYYYYTSEGDVPAVILWPVGITFSAKW